MKTDETVRETIVIGAGVSGLSAAWYLKNAGVDVALLEADTAVGGCMRTEQRDGFLLEKGPFNVIIRDPAFEEVLTELSEELTVITADRAARARYLYRKGRLMLVPTGPVGLVTTPLLSFGGKLRLLRGLLASRRARQECTIEDFAVRRCGREVSDTLVSALISGIVAGDIRKLSVNACFPSLTGFDRKARSPLGYGVSKAVRAMFGRGEKRRRRKWRGLVSIDRGLGALSEAMAKPLGEDLTTGCRVETVSIGENGYSLSCRVDGDGERLLRCRRLVVAVSAGEAGRLLSPVIPGAEDILGSIESASLVVLNMAFRAADVGHPLQGFGFLVPHNEPDFPLMGVLWADSAFPHHGKPEHRLVRVFIGGTRTPDVMSRSEGELVATARQGLREHLDITGEPTLVDVCSYPRAIPQYYLGHAGKIERLRAQAAAVPGLHLVGNYLEGVSINDCIRLGKSVAQEIIGADG